MALFIISSCCWTCKFRSCCCCCCYCCFKNGLPNRHSFLLSCFQPTVLVPVPFHSTGRTSLQQLWRCKRQLLKMRWRCFFSSSQIIALWNQRFENINKAVSLVYSVPIIFICCFQPYWWTHCGRHCCRTVDATAVVEQWRSDRNAMVAWIFHLLCQAVWLPPPSLPSAPTPRLAPKCWSYPTFVGCLLRFKGLGCTQGRDFSYWEIICTLLGQVWEEVDGSPGVPGYS